jgi:hypothetical protein
MGLREEMICRNKWSASAKLALGMTADRRILAPSYRQARRYNVESEGVWQSTM